MDGIPIAANVRVEGECCRLDGDVLAHVDDTEPPSALASLIHDSFRSLALNPHFSCLGAQAAVRQSNYHFGLFHTMAAMSSSAALARGLTHFNADGALGKSRLTAFVASFVSPVPSSESDFERLLWTTLQQLSDLDREPWAQERGADPGDARFSFSFGGVAFFVVGMHAGSSRLARRFAWPSLVFNPHDQFDRLRREGKYARFRDMIRARDVALQGSVNPMLGDFGDESEARQYSGRSVSPDWKCPFHPGHHKAAPGAEE
jgi:FPC/CPF motif-containing protein YcgG